MVAPTQRSTWWFFVLLIALILAVWIAVAAGRTDKCSEDSPRSWTWFPPGWECPQRL